MVPLSDDLEQAPVGAALLSDQVRSLRTLITAARPGTAETLFAQHVLESSGGSWLAQEGPPPNRAAPATLAIRGYRRLLDTAQDAGFDDIADDVQRLRQMDAFPLDRHSFLYDPVLMIGISGAIAAAHGSANESGSAGARRWLIGLLRDARLDGDLVFLTLTRAYCLHLLTRQPSPLPRLTDLRGTVETGFAVWLLLRGAGEFPDRRDTYEAVAEQFLSDLLIEDVSSLSIPRAAICLAATIRVTQLAARTLVTDLDTLASILRTFPACMQRWRWDSDDVRHPVRWQIDAEREIQDILWIMLRPYFPDLEYEDPLPKVGHAHYRPDLSIPSLRVVVEVKYARKASDFKELESQVMVDSVAYLAKTDRYDRIVVFIYDDSSSNEEHDATRRALMDIPVITDVVIVSRPGRIPPRSDRTPTARKTAAKVTAARRASAAR